MSFSGSSARLFLGLVIAVLSALMAFDAQAQGKTRARSIEFSEPTSRDAITNLNQVTVKKDGLKQLEDAFYGPLRSFTPKTSLDPVLTPPERRAAPSALQSKRAKELLERQRNWIFLNPDDLADAPTVEQIFNITEYDENGQPKQKLSPVEQYMEDEDNKRTGKNKSGKGKDGKSKSYDFYGSRLGLDASDDKEKVSTEESRLLGRLSEREDAIKKTFNKDLERNPLMPSRGTFSDIFGLGANKLSDAETLKHKAYMTEFQNILNSSPASSDAFSPLGGSKAPTFSPASSFGSFPGASRPESSSSLMGAAPSFNSSASRGGFPTTINSASQPAATPTPTKVTPPTPSFSAPRRAF